MPNTPLNKEELQANIESILDESNFLPGLSHDDECGYWGTEDGSGAEYCDCFTRREIDAWSSTLTSILDFILADRDAAVREARVEEQLEGKQQAWNHIWDAWLKGDDDDFDDFMRQYNAELWPPESQPNAKEGS